MFNSVIIACLMAKLPVTEAHFTFVRAAVNNEWQAPTRYIRNKTAPYEEISTPDTNSNTRSYNFPTYATDRPDSVRCGRDNMAYAADTDILSLRAGDTLEFAHQRYDPEYWTDAMWNNCTFGRGSCDPAKAQGIMDINHPGPFMAHLSKAPDGQDVRTYDGSGEWVKIYTLGLEVRPNQTEPVHRLAWNDQQLPGRFLLRIPTQTPAGQYLLRLDEVNTGLEEPGFSSSPAQVYPSCMQIEIMSEVYGTLPSGVTIPEALAHTAPGMAQSLSMYRRLTVDETYVYPGGPLWDGESLIHDKPAL